RSASVRTGQSSSGARCGEERQPSPLAIRPAKILYFRGIPMTEPAAHAERLPRTLGVWSAAFILVGITIGSGIFRVPAQIAVTLGSPGAFLLVWVIGGLITLAGALPIAEDRKSTRLNSSHVKISYAVFCLKKKKSYISPKQLNQWVISKPSRMILYGPQ